MTLAINVLTNEDRYRSATAFYAQEGLSPCLKRQWKFITEAEQRWLLCGVASMTAATVTFFTLKGIEYGKWTADSLSLKDLKRTAVIAGGGATGFTIGLGASIYGEGWVLEHSKRLEDWKKVNINKIIENIMVEDFQADPIWSQFLSPISLQPMFFPMRTPGGQVCELVLTHNFQAHFLMTLRA